MEVEAGSRPSELGDSGPQKRKISGPLLLIALAISAIGLFVTATRRGLALGSDSAAYIAAARNLVEGFGLSWLSGGVEAKPLVLHAPLYSLILAAFESISIGSLDAARGINALAYGLTVILFGFLAHRLTNSWIFSLLGALILASTGEFFQVYVWAMSDPLYIVLSMGALVFMLNYLESGSFPLFAASVFAASSAYLTRYAGLSLVVALTFILLLIPRISFKTRTIRAGILFITGILPTSAWFVRNTWLTGQIAGRTFGRNAANLLDGSEEAVSIILNWFLPLNLVEWLHVRPPILGITALVGIITLSLIVFFSMRKWSKRKDEGPAPPIALLGSYMLTYLGLMGYSYLFSNPGTDLIERTFAPLYPIALALFILVLQRLWELRHPWLRILIAVACLMLLRNKALYTYYVVDDLLSRGQGYTSTSWQQSETIARLAEIDPELVYTNDIAAVYLLTNSNVYLVPVKYDTANGSPRSDYRDNLELMFDRIESERALLVLFKPESQMSESFAVDDLVKELKPIAILDDGVIYGSERISSNE